ncbi:hypothetical protein NPIL_423951 [Nephila pilipes]|uniref:Uncharacterized protein n=1 Tax=Nephila pilipes TaxID=299642 RepID=A0A8X6TW54_NEPPI|nr:hypothetical protein NPIL_423951 [Nephila pilipes]
MAMTSIFTTSGAVSVAFTTSGVTAAFISQMAVLLLLHLLWRCRVVTDGGRCSAAGEGTTVSAAVVMVLLLTTIHYTHTYTTV